MTTCLGSSVYVDGQPYNARGRPMLLTTCPVCGREFRRQGKSTTTMIPKHGGSS